MRRLLRFCSAAVIFLSLGNTSKAQIYDQTTPYQTITTNNQSFTFTFTGVTGVITNNATLIVYYEGDFGASSEYVMAYAPNGTLIGQTTPEVNGNDCAPEDTTAMHFNGLILNGFGSTLNFTLTTTPDVDFFCGVNQVKARLIFDYCQNADLNAIANVSVSSNNICPGGEVALLTGTPSGGTFSGPGVTGNVFNPANLATGYYTVSYTSTDNFGCTTTDDTTIFVQSAPVVNTVPVSCSTFNGTISAVSASPTLTWYSDQALTNVVTTGQNLTLSNITNDTTFYLAYLTEQFSFTADTFTFSNAAIIDHDAITGDDRGGIAVTDSFVYVVGDDSTARYDLNLQNGVALPGMDGLFTDLATNELYTLYNTTTGTAEPPFNSGDQPVFNAIRKLNSDLTFSDDSIMLDRTFSLNQNWGYQNGMYAGAGILIIYSSDDQHAYVINLRSGATQDLGVVTNFQNYNSENWTSWGVAEFDGTNYSVLYRHNNDANIHRRMLPNGTDNIVGAFNDVSDMASFTYATVNNRWYFHFEGGSELSGWSETLGYADATADTTALGLLNSCARAVTVDIDTQFAITVNQVTATYNCSGVNTLTATANGGGTLTYQWMLNGTPLTEGGIYTGTQTNTLSIADTTGLIDSVYTLVVSNACGSSVSSAPFTLTNVIGNTWTGATDNDWDDATNWSCGEVPTVTTNVIIPNVTNDPIVNITGAICNDITLGTGASLTFAGTTNQLDINGNLTNNGTFNGANGTVVFSGANAQNIASATFDRLQVTGGTDKTLTGNVTVLGNLDLNNGNMVLGNNNLTLATPWNQSGGSNSSFIITNGTGSVVGQGMGANGGNPDAVMFHVGTAAGAYNPIMLENLGDADTFSVSVMDSVYADGYGTVPVTVNSPVVNKTWMVSENTPGGSLVNMTPFWNHPGDEINGFDTAHVYVAHYTGGQWTSEFDSALAAPGALVIGNMLAAFEDSITTLSPFAVGSSGQFPLVIKLMDVNAANAGSRNKVNWRSGAEAAGDNYIVETSVDGKSFTHLTTVKASGKPSAYTYWHETPVTGVNYYRIKTVDADNKISYSKVVSATVKAASVFVVEAFPNPLTSNVTVMVKGATAGTGYVTVNDVTGKVIKSAVKVENNKAELNLSDVTTGVYFINYADDANHESIKINKQ